MKIHFLEIQMGRIGIQGKIRAIQNDSGRVLRCAVADMSIPEGATAVIYAVKPSKNEVYNNCGIDRNTVIVELTSQLLAETGLTYCQIQILKDVKSVTSFEFVIEVSKNLVSDSAIESSNEYKAFEQGIEDIKNLENPVFEQAETRANINSGESYTTIFGKIRKWFADLGSAAFLNVVNGVAQSEAGVAVLDAAVGRYLDEKKLDIAAVINNLTTTAGGYALDARQGKALMDFYNSLNSNLKQNNISVFAGQFGAYGCSFPATAVCRKYMDNTCDIHISCGCEIITPLTTTDIFDSSLMLRAFGISAIHFHPFQTKVTVNNDRLDSAPEYIAYGRTGLMMDSSMKCFTRIYNENMDTGVYGTELKSLYVCDRIFQIDIIGAVYE